MFDFSLKDSIGRKITELKNTLLQYSKQEIRDPLISLLKWTAFGLIGLIFIIAGLGHICLRILRLLQSEVSTFERSLSFLPYFIIFVFLALIAALSYRSIRSR